MIKLSRAILVVVFLLNLTPLSARAASSDQLDQIQQERERVRQQQQINELRRREELDRLQRDQDLQKRQQDRDSQRSKA